MSALFARILTMCPAAEWVLPVFVLALVLAAACFLTDAKSAYPQPVHTAASRFFRELNRVASGK